MNSRSPSPSRRKRGPWPSRAGFTALTIDSRPLAVPAFSNSASCAWICCSSLASGMSGPLAQLAEHVVDHGGERVLRFPVPFLARCAVVERLGPGVGDGLPPRIDRVLHPEARHPRADLRTQLLGREVD